MFTICQDSVRTYRKHKKTRGVGGEINSTRIQSIWQVLIVLFFTVMLLVVSPAYVGAAVRFVVTGDTRGCTDERPINNVMIEELVQATLNEDADFIVITGDLVNGYTSAEALKSQLIQWRDIMEELKGAGKGVYPCRGNHDLNVDGQHNDEVKQVWDEVFRNWALPDNGPLGEKYITYSVSFNDENVFIVVLDTYVNSHRINQTWLNEQFDNNDLKHVFVFAHEPAFSVRHKDCLDDYPNARNDFWNSIKSEGGRHYFAAHFTQRRGRFC